MKYIYIGSFPPPYGGVTVKNSLIYKNLKKVMQIDFIDFGFIRNKIIINFFRLLKAMMGYNNTLILGIGSNNALDKFSSILYYLNKKTMSRSVVMIMGGTADQYFTLNAQKIKIIKSYKKIYVETNKMKEKFINSGVDNVAVFPNCRELPEKSIEVKLTGNTLKCVYFSQISEEKGADLVIETAKLLAGHKSEYQIDFYGPINDKYEKKFFADIDGLSNIKYCGIFKTDENDVYKKLNEYDVLLFPTRWKHEGVPGILVESKIAGIPSIVSDINYNSEIIKHGFSGIVLNDNSSKELAENIKALYLDKEMLNQLKNGAKASSENYIIDYYINEIANVIINPNK